MFALITTETDKTAGNSYASPQIISRVPVILIVEDDEDSRLMLKTLLEMWNYRVLEAADGIEAISIAEQACPDLILMDAKLPNLDGFETTRRIRQSAMIKDVPIIFLSACAEAVYRNRASDAGANEYLVKPLVFEQLEITLEKYLCQPQKNYRLTLVHCKLSFLTCLMYHDSMATKPLELTETECRYLTTLTSSGELKARQFKRAMTLLLLSEGKPMTAVSKTLKFSYPRVIALRDNYLENGLKCLEEKPRSGRPVVFDGTKRAKITALACSETPEGYANWSLRLLADRLVELEICPTISHTQVGQVLKKTNSSRI